MRGWGRRRSDPGNLLTMSSLCKGSREPTYRRGTGRQGPGPAAASYISTKGVSTRFISSKLFIDLTMGQAFF